VGSGSDSPVCSRHAQLGTQTARVGGTPLATIVGFFLIIEVGLVLLFAL
jgi:hypothetical protein